jgi:hypothetical protein
LTIETRNNENKQCVNLPQGAFCTNNKSCFAMHTINNMAKTLVKIGRGKNGKMLKSKTKCTASTCLSEQYQTL